MCGEFSVASERRSFQKGTFIGEGIVRFSVILFGGLMQKTLCAVETYQEMCFHFSHIRSPAYSRASGNIVDASGFSVG